ncbi:helix-turn-helix domain-containing protein, partial [Pseudomonas viridiflava]|uniref:helix-turn-helix domain-containing protein n=2 Tax=Pseudomonas TaxID=286 RepID=UPI0013E0ABF3
MDINQLRISALRTAMAGLSQKDFANQHGLDASYLSQLLNGHRKLGEKAAATLEEKINLSPGTLVNPERSAESDASEVSQTTDATPIDSRRVM